MAWSQNVGPNTGIQDKAGWCLRFVQSVYGTPARYASAWDAWNATGQKYETRDMPNVSVPVWFSHYGNYDGTGNKNWGHVVAWVPGSGFLSSPGNGYGQQWFGSISEIENYFRASCVGFSADLNGVQIASYSADSGSSAPALSAQGDHIAAEGSDWTYWVPSTQDQATVQAGLALTGQYGGPIDGNLASDASVRAIQMVTGLKGFFDLRYFDGQMNKNLCQAILLMAQTAGYSGRMDWQIDGHVWAAFDAAVRASVPAPVVVTPVEAPAEEEVTEETSEPEEVTEQVIEPIVEEPIVAEEIAAQPVNQNVISAEQYEKIVAANAVGDNSGEGSKYNLISLGFWNYAGERVIKTFAMTFSSLLTATGAVVMTTPGAANIFASIGWVYIVSVSGVSALTSLAVALSSFKDIVTLKK